MNKKSKENSKASITHQLVTQYLCDEASAKKRTSTAIKTVQDAFGISFSTQTDGHSPYNFTKHEKDIILAEASRNSVTLIYNKTNTFIQKLKETNYTPDIADTIKMVSFFLPYYLYKDWSDTDKSFIVSHAKFLMNTIASILILSVRDKHLSTEYINIFSADIQLLFSSIATFNHLPEREWITYLF